jgi:hypothetical protein
VNTTSARRTRQPTGQKKTMRGGDGDRRQREQLALARKQRRLERRRARRRCAESAGGCRRLRPVVVRLAIVRSAVVDDNAKDAGIIAHLRE